MSYLSFNNECCGVGELTGLEDYLATPEELIRTVQDYCEDQYEYTKQYNPELTKHQYFVERCPPFILFSTAMKKQGTALARYIRRNKLGTVWQSRPRYNPTGSPNLIVW